MCTANKFQSRLLALFAQAMQSVKDVVNVAVPGWDGLAAFNSAVAAAQAALNAWHDGQPIDQVVQAIDAVIQVVTSLQGAIPQQYVVIIDVALAGLKSVLVLLEQHAPSTSVTAETPMLLKAAYETYDMPEHPVYATAKQYKQAWNEAIAPFPELASAHIK